MNNTIVFEGSYRVALYKILCEYYIDIYIYNMRYFDLINISCSISYVSIIIEIIAIAYASYHKAF